MLFYLGFFLGVCTGIVGLSLFIRMTIKNANKRRVR